MRKLTAEIKEAFEEGRKLTKSNTFTDGQSVWLHGNKIAQHVEGGIKVSLAGWNSVTTRERVNALIPTYMGFVQLNYEAKFVDNRDIENLSKLSDIDVDKWHYFGYDGTVNLNVEG